MASFQSPTATYVIDARSNAKHIVSCTVECIQEVVRHFYSGSSRQSGEPGEADQEQDGDLENSHDAVGGLGSASHKSSAGKRGDTMLTSGTSNPT